MHICGNNNQFVWNHSPNYPPLPNRHVFGEQPTKVSIFRTFVGVSRSLLHLYDSCAALVDWRFHGISPHILMAFSLPRHRDWDLNLYIAHNRPAIPRFWTWALLARTVTLNLADIQHDTLRHIGVPPNPPMLTRKPWSASHSSRFSSDDLFRFMYCTHPRNRQYHSTDIELSILARKL